MEAAKLCAPTRIERKDGTDSTNKARQHRRFQIRFPTKHAERRQEGSCLSRRCARGAGATSTTTNNGKSMQMKHPNTKANLVTSIARWLAIGCVGVCLGLAGSTILGAPFPGQGDDNTSSIAVFRIAVNPNFESLLDLDPSPTIFSPYPGYNFTTKRLTSPLLIQGNTTIGRSAPGTSPLGTVAVGTAGTLIGPADYSAVPPQFLNPPAGTREVRTEVRDLNLVTGGE